MVAVSSLQCSLLAFHQIDQARGTISGLVILEQRPFDQYLPIVAPCAKDFHPY